MDRDPQPSPEHESAEDEGIPDIGRPHPTKRATGDPQEGLMVPRDRPRAADDWGTTAQEQREEEPLGDRLDDELPDVEPGERVRAGRLVDDGPEDTEPEMIADLAVEDELEGLSAEEAALRVEDAPGGLTDHPDDYVEGDAPTE
jgi:hypothetical protein